MRCTNWMASALCGAALAIVPLSVATAAEENAAPTAPAESLQSATFAAGCFWCVESDFDKVPGVVETISGYAGGHTPNPTYETVGRGDTGHLEVVRVRFDPAVVSYAQLLDYYWRHVDLTDGDGQFCDRGDQYRPAIFTHDDEQDRLARQSKAALEKSGRFNQPIAVKIARAGPFTPAEDYHQDFYKKDPKRYQRYRKSCGRDQRLKELWGDTLTGK